MRALVFRLILSTAAAAGNPEQDLLYRLMIDEALDRLDGRCPEILESLTR